MAADAPGGDLYGGTRAFITRFVTKFPPVSHFFDPRTPPDDSVLDPVFEAYLYEVVPALHANFPTPDGALRFYRATDYRGSRFEDSSVPPPPIGRCGRNMTGALLPSDRSRFSVESISAPRSKGGRHLVPDWVRISG